MILVKSKSKGFVGLLVGTQGIPKQPKIVTATPKIEIEWVGIVLVNDAWIIRPLVDLVPVIPDDGATQT